LRTWRFWKEAKKEEKLCSFSEVFIKFKDFKSAKAVIQFFYRSFLMSDKNGMLIKGKN